MHACERGANDYVLHILCMAWEETCIGYLLANGWLACLHAMCGLAIVYSGYYSWVLIITFNIRVLVQTAIGIMPNGTLISSM